MVQELALSLLVSVYIHNCHYTHFQIPSIHSKNKERLSQIANQEVVDASISVAESACIQTVCWFRFQIVRNKDASGNSIKYNLLSEVYLLEMPIEFGS